MYKHFLHKRIKQAKHGKQTNTNYYIVLCWPNITKKILACAIHLTCGTNLPHHFMRKMCTILQKLFLMRFILPMKQSKTRYILTMTCSDHLQCLKEEHIHILENLNVNKKTHHLPKSLRAYYFDNSTSEQ